MGLDEAGGEDSVLIFEEHNRQQVVANVPLLAHLRRVGGLVNKGCLQKWGYILHQGATVLTNTYAADSINNNCLQDVLAT